MSLCAGSCSRSSPFWFASAGHFATLWHFPLRADLPMPGLSDRLRQMALAVCFQFSWYLVSSHWLRPLGVKSSSSVLGSSMVSYKFSTLYDTILILSVLLFFRVHPCRCLPFLRGRFVSVLCLSVGCLLHSG